MGRRVATACLPAPALQLAARERPALKAVPVALGEGGRVRGCSRRALAAGVREGQTLTRARAACPDLVVVEPDPHALAGLRREVVDAIGTVAPGAEWAGGGCFHVEATGLARLHGSEHGLLVALWRALSGRRLVARVGCADTRLVSALAARLGRGFTVVPPGGAARFLAPLPLSLLPLPADAAERLALLGVRSVGAFARLPADGLAARFGPEVTRWQRLARGEDPRPLALEREDSRPCAARDLDEPVSGLEPVTFLLKSVAEDLCDQLARRGTGAAGLELALVLDDADRRPAGGDLQRATPRDVRRATPRDVRRLRPSRPLVAARTILELCRLELETRPVAAPIEALALSAEEEAVDFRTADLFAGHADPAALFDAVDRLRALLGPERVVTPEPREAWRREARVGWRPFDPRRDGGEAGAPAETAGAAEAGAVVAIPLERPAPPEGSERLLPAPAVAAVRLPGRQPDGMAVPGRLVLPVEARRLGEAAGEVEVVAASAPLRVAGEWWDGGADVDRDEHLLLCRDGGVWRAFLDRRRGRWYVTGCLD